MFFNVHFAVVGLFCAIAEQEIAMKHGVDTYREFRHALLAASCFLTLLLLINIYITYRLELNLDKMRGEVSQIDGLSWGKIRWLCFEFLICGMTSSSLFIDTTYVEYIELKQMNVVIRINAIFVSLMLFRVYLVI